MNRITYRTPFFFLFLVLAVSPAMAKTKSRLTTIGQEFKVGGTALKAGTYYFNLDTKTNELTVSDRKSKQVIARAQATAGPRTSKTASMEIKLSEDSAKTLVAIAFPGDKEAYVVSSSSSAGN